MHILKKTQENINILGKLLKILNLSKRTAKVPWHSEIEVTMVKKAKRPPLLHLQEPKTSRCAAVKSLMCCNPTYP